LRPSRVFSTLLGLTFLAGAVACQSDDDLVDVPGQTATPPETPGAPIEEAPSFLAVPRAGSAGTGSANITLIRQMLSQAQSTTAAADAFDPEGSFYLAVHRRELGKRWFASAYLKQFFPGAVLAGAAVSLGTRVVSFKIQNDKLFVFDVDDRKQTSDTFTQDVIVDAYPLVDAAKVGAGKLKDYVLVDPAAGLNQYGVVDDGFGSGYLGFNRFVVELAFSQHFRQLKDGASFEQAFTGYTQEPRFNEEGVEPNFFRASGVLGLALRRYSEGEGFQPQQLGPGPLYFGSVPKLVPSTGEVEELTAYWNVRPGMKPIRWLISPLVKKVGQRPELQELGIDLAAVVKAGIESWNTAFGFPVLEARLADGDDSFADDDKNYFIWDVNPTVGFAFADWRLNPNTGEIRGASVYFNDAFVDSALEAFAPDEPAGPAEDATPVARAKKHPALAWQPFPRRPLCNLAPSPLARQRKLLPLGEGLPATRKERVEKAIASIVAHEIGHTLGLRHNFKGSLLPPTSSVMDYNSDQLMAAAAIPGAYDVAAIRHLYTGGPRPGQPFCTDDHIIGDPRCAQFDEGADPLQEYWGPFYQAVTRFYLTTGQPIGERISDLLMDYLVGFAQRADTPAERLVAWNLLVGDIQVPVPPQRLAIPTYPDAANHLTRSLFTRLVPDAARPVPRTWNGIPVPLPPLDPVVGGLLRDELRGNLLNLDGFRSFLTRRSSVDSLKTWQTLAAFNVLREARVVLEPPAEPPLPPEQQALVEDLLARIQRAVTPYFNK
jgi:Met-zincin